MKQFSYTITDPVGLHARPAGVLVKECKSYPEVKILIEKGGKSVECVKLLALMGLGVKCGDTVTFTLEGAGEDEAAEKLEAFCRDNF